MSILKAFTNHLKEFINDMQRVFPGDSDLRTSKIFLEGTIKINPKSVIVSWKECVNDVYYEKIIEGDIEFFINKDYSADLEGAKNKSKILQTIGMFRTKMNNMDDENKKKCMKYIQNLTKLCHMYFSK